MDALITTLVKRPYVFLFLLGFLFLSIKHQGLVKTIVWLVVGYFIAFLSEYSSINNGFPYGQYYYLYGNLKGELIFAGVPVWDSLSYTFLSYAGYSTAAFAAAPKTNAWKIWLGGSLLTCILDIITDPVAKLGKDWFLGEIYYYAEKGIYFNVPLSNFAGWFFVAAIIIGLNMLIFKGEWSQDNRVGWLHLIFYASICLFSTAIAFFIGAYLLGFVNTLITGVTLLALILKRSSCQNEG